MRLFDESDNAEFSPCRQWRYTLHRQWEESAEFPQIGGGNQGVAFLMFNPSTADETTNDPTIRKCIGFAKRWGYGRLIILNLFAYRSTDPTAIARVHDPVGPLNMYWIRKSIKECREVICAWGCGQHMKQDRLRDAPSLAYHAMKLDEPYLHIQCLGRREDGHPRHPLMLPYTTPREPFVL